MPLVKRTHDLRTLAQSAGVVVGVVAGLVLFGTGMQTFFTGGAKDWLELILFLSTVLALLSLLPLAVLGIFKPRFAAYGVTASTLLNLVCPLAQSLRSGDRLGMSAHNVVLYLLLPSAAAGLLFWASGRD